MRPENLLLQWILCCVAVNAIGWGGPPVARAESQGASTEVVIELSHFGSGLVDGRRMLLPTISMNGDEFLVQSGAGSLEIFLRPPRDSRLVVGIPASLSSNDFSLEVATDIGSKTLQGARQGDEWQASLAEFDDRPIKLRFVNRSTGPISWKNPRIVGKPGAGAPILEVGPVLERRPLNVILYLIDTLRADRISHLGYSRKTSPNIDRLAAKGITFTNAYSPGSYTLPSVSSLFASQFPSALNGHLARGGRSKETLAESFRKAGYSTAGFQANTLVGAVFEDYQRGFQHYEAFPRRTTGAGRGFVPASTLRYSAMKWITAHKDEPFFVYIQSMDVHGPSHAPPPYEEKFIGAPRVPEPEGLDHVRTSKGPSDRYDGRIAYQDHEIGILVKRLRQQGLADDTAIVITSDHGEPLGERGYRRHGRTLFEELVHVPLILYLPGESPQRIPEIVSIMDLGPTILDIAGISKPEGLAGRSLVAPRDGRDPPTAIGELLRPKTLVVRAWYVRQGEFKMIMNAKGEKLYHLTTDPSEDVDKSADFPVTTGYLATLAWNSSPVLQGASKGEPSMSPEDARRMEAELKALGYID